MEIINGETQRRKRLEVEKATNNLTFKDGDGNIQSLDVTINALQKNKNKMKILLISCLVFSISIGNLYSQNKTIKGRVIDENLEILPSILVLTNDTVKIGKTDSNGYFQMEIPIPVKKILLRGVGMETASIELGDKCEEIEVIMMSGDTYDFISLKKVDRKRRNRFKMLPKLHKEAFDKGIFRIVNACYIQEFIPYFKKN